MSTLLGEGVAPYGGTPGVKYQITDNGYLLLCDCPVYRSHSWCEHVKNAIVEMLDKRSIFRLPGQNTSNRVRVPVYPTGGFYLDVLLTPMNHAGMWRATLDVGEEHEPIDLGVIMEGLEGRRQLRAALIAWITEASRNVYCNAGIHSGVRWSKASRGVVNERDLSTAYNILTTGRCGDCDAYFRTDDDVPEI